MKILQKGLLQLEEKDLTHDVLIPLINKLHPGRIEYTHSAIEAGRDLVSFGKDNLNRPHILCVQVKADKVTYGSKFQEIVVSPTLTAKKEGVTLDDGSKSIPNEVWFITSASFPEQNRRQVSDTLIDLAKNNIKFIAGEELSDLVQNSIPKVATKICKYANKEIIDLISALSKNSDGIAFEMNSDSNIDDFYVTASFLPYLKNHNLMTSDSSVVSDHSHDYDSNVYDFLLDEEEVSSTRIYDLILEREESRIKTSKFQEKCNVKFNVSIELFYKKITDSPVKILKKTEIEQYLPNIKNENIFVKINNTTFLHKHYAKLIKQVINNVRKCPKILTEKYDSIINTCKSISELDSFISHTSNQFKNSVNYKETGMPANEFLLKIKIPKPEYLISLGDLILIEGPPGCGKTTILRKMAISLLEKSKKIKYINCCTIKNSYQDKSLTDIVNNYAIGELHNEYKNDECILILDGLDESPFDLTSIILKGYCLFSTVIMSSRSAYSANIRSNCFNITLSPFSSQERNEFFKKILQNDENKIEQANYLFKTYPDIDNHTKLPIIAALTATLLNNGFTPTTRSEIYNFRLELLLSKWDRARGVSRIEIDNPKAKIRFLRKLAYRMHDFETRNRFISEFDLRETYEDSLGSWGYEYSFKTFINDLVKGSGILIETTANEYTFGHLSFQEHLAGEYLAENSSVSEILDRLGNDWWKEPLNFWASREGSITKLLDKVFNKVEYLGFTKQLLEMCICAPYTSAAIVEILKEERRSNEI